MLVRSLEEVNHHEREIEIHETFQRYHAKKQSRFSCFGKIPFVYLGTVQLTFRDHPVN